MESNIHTLYEDSSRLGNRLESVESKIRQVMYGESGVDDCNEKGATSACLAGIFEEITRSHKIIDRLDDLLSNILNDVVDK